MSLPPACGGSKMMITIDRFLSDPDTAESALFNADVMFTFIPPYFYIYPTCTYSTFLMSLLPFGRSMMSTMIILNHCQFLSSFSFTYYFPSHFFARAISLTENGSTISSTFSIHFLYIQHLFRYTLNTLTRIIHSGEKRTNTIDKSNYQYLFG